MARRQSSGGETLLGILALAVFGLVAAIPYIVTAAFYTLPLLLIYLFRNISKGSCPELVETAESATQQALQALQAKRSELFEQIDAILSQGRAEGVRYIEREDRFELRSNRGQELNAELETAGAALAEVETKIEVAQDPELNRIIGWEAALYEWHRRRAFRVALYAALLVFLGGILVIELSADMRGVELPLWNPAPSLFRASFAISAMIAWIVVPIVLFVSLRVCRNAAEQRYVTAWNEMVDSLNTEQDDSEEPSFDESPEPAIENPYGVLKVPVDAAVAEIKVAYRSAIKLCHPDTVADRSDAIKEAAEQESLRINLAYETIRAERGF